MLADRPISPFVKLAYGLVIFAGAFLLFQVQPIAGRMVLPWFGGSAAVWATCLLFFQSMLLLGYVYAFASIRWLSARAERWTHLTLLALSVLALPLALNPDWKPLDPEHPGPRLLLLLSVTVGLPYLTLATTSPLLQAWYARIASGTLPYRLFAVSNLGSMLALLGYPVLIEPLLTLRQQTSLWSGSYLCFAVACALLAWTATRSPVAKGLGVQQTKAAWPGRVLAACVALAFCPSALLLSVTSHLTQNVAPVPLLWIAPLALYLLSFILCFESTRWYRRRTFVPIGTLALVATTLAILDDGRVLGLMSAAVVFCAGLFVASMFCHGELAARKPHPDHLTGYYLAIAFGGMLGGIFVALLAPVVFDDYYEFPLAIVGTALICCLAVADRARPGHWQKVTLLAGLAAALLTALVHKPVSTATESRIVARNFYGAVRTRDWGNDDARRRTLQHGRIIHGMQLAGSQRRSPTTYYGPASGVGLAIMATRSQAPQRVGVIGLGAGVLAAYGRAGDVYRFYEINPLVADIARREFSFIADSAADSGVVLGDARLTLEREAGQLFDVLVVDAFSGDSIPMHLLTREAFELYFRHLRPGGVLAVNVSNRYLELTGVAAQSAYPSQAQVRVVDTADDMAAGLYTASWLLASRSAQLFAHPLMRGAAAVQAGTAGLTWTDDYSSIYRVLR